MSEPTNPEQENSAAGDKELKNQDEISLEELDGVTGAGRLTLRGEVRRPIQPARPEHYLPEE